MESDDKGYYFNYSKHLNEAKLSENELTAATGVSKSILNKIKRAKDPVSKHLLHAVFDAINGPLSSPSENKSSHRQFEDDYSSWRQLELNIFGSKDSRTIEGISPVEFAILSLTNPKVWTNSSEEQPFRIITSNEIYYYIPFIASMLDFDSEEAEEVFGDRMEYFLSTLQTAFRARFQTNVPILSADRNLGELDGELVELLKSSRSPEEIKRTNATLKSLCERGLIVDPLVETVGLVGVSVLGLVPTSFTKRTEDGDVVYRKISALLWEYEYLNEGEKKELKLHFNVQKIVDNFKGLIYNLNKQINDNQPE